MESSHFLFDTKSWLSEGAIKGPVRVGSAKGSSIGFGGRISCLQLYQHYFSPSQVWIMKTCPVPENYEVSSDCPSGFFPYKDTCYKVSEEELKFSEAEIKCSSEPESPYLTRLAYPTDYRSKAFLSHLLNSTQYNISQIWVGLDRRSDNAPVSTTWTTSDGTRLDEIPWAEGEPGNGEQNQCVFMDSEVHG